MRESNFLGFWCEINHHEYISIIASAPPGHFYPVRHISKYRLHATLFDHPASRGSDESIVKNHANVSDPAFAIGTGNDCGLVVEPSITFSVSQQDLSIRSGCFQLFRPYGSLSLSPHAGNREVFF